MGLRPGGDVRMPLRPHLRLLDLPSGEVFDLLAPDVPAHHPGKDEHGEFTCSRLYGSVLLQCTRTGVVWIDLATRKIIKELSHPLLHDVHDALIHPDGSLSIASTGLDSICHFHRDGTLLAHHHVGFSPFKERFGAHTDFRDLPFRTFKPHEVHPNHLTWYKDELWFTGLETQTFAPVGGGHPGLHLQEGLPHDGLQFGDELWFTTVNGYVLAYDTDTLRRTRRLHLPSLMPRKGQMGWIRGLAKYGQRLFVGMTLLRTSRIRERFREWWLDTAYPRHPTQVIEVDLNTNRVVATYPVGNPKGGTLYSLHVLDPADPFNLTSGLDSAPTAG